VKKSEIESRGRSGSRIDGSDVATLSRDMRVMTLKHVWSDNADGRVLDTVRRAFMREAHRIADMTGKSVEVYSKHGSMLECVEPS
jgi:hypothetical protein